LRIGPWSKKPIMRKPNLDAVHNIDGLALLAQRRLPRVIFDFLDGGAEREVTLKANRAGFDQWQLLPEVLKGNASRTISVTLFGHEMQTPFLVAPTGLNGILWPRGDSQLARACARGGTGLCVSTASNESLETLAQAGKGLKLFQLYTWGSREDWLALMRRAEQAGYHGLILTADSLIAGNRERDKRNRFAHAVTLSPSTLIDGLTHPSWLFSTWLPHGMPRLENIADRLPAGSSAYELAAYGRKQRSEGLSWADVEWIRSQWRGPLLIKGILRVSDALIAQRLGAEGIVISNHGGRALDSVPATIDLLPEIASALGKDMTVLIDSGFRRGTDIVKALALGADAVLLGRAPLYGLAAAGEQGVAKALTLLASEVERTLGQLGCASIAELNSAHVRRCLHGGR